MSRVTSLLSALTLVLIAFAVLPNTLAAQQCPQDKPTFFSVDFETDAASQALGNGDVITTQLALLDVSATGGTNEARIYDSSCGGSNDPNDCFCGDEDLGTPTGPAGPGFPINAPGNTVARGNVIIVQSNDNQCIPNDEADGGNLQFVFGGAVDLDNVTILDHEETGSSINTYSDDGCSVPISSTPVGNIGNNAVETFAINDTDVLCLEVDFVGSGAVAEMVGCEGFTIQLPVELTSFDAITDGSDVNLTWETASETNNAGFEVQTRIAGQGGEWNVVGFVDGIGTTQNSTSYAFTVGDLSPGAHSFRLKQIDFDGSFDYSSVVEARIELPGAFSVEAIYPNPMRATGALELAVRNSELVDVGLYNVVGQRVADLFFATVEAGSTSRIDLDLSAVPSGTYLIRVAGESFTASELVNVLK